MVQSAQLVCDIAFDPWLAYLAGPGLAGVSKEGNLYLKRGAITGRFELECVFRRPRKDEDGEKDRHQIAEALWLLGTLGGLGSRARRGWGSLSLKSLSGGANLSAPQTVADMQATLAVLLKQPAEYCPPFSAFSAESRIDVWSKSGSNAMAVLSMAGHEFLRYRGYGRNFGNGHLIGVGEMGREKWVGEEARQNFKLDHDIAEAVAKQKTAITDITHPARVVFGLPHNSYFNRLKEGVSMQPATRRGETEGTQRRASPLLMHVHCFGKDNAMLVQSFLPAQFLPDGMQIAMRRQKNNITGAQPGPSSRVDAQPDWEVVRHYLDACDTQRGLPHNFADRDRQTIWPVPT